jgi:hypothetical protein
MRVVSEPSTVIPSPESPANRNPDLDQATAEKFEESFESPILSPSSSPLPPGNTQLPPRKSSLGPQSSPSRHRRTGMHCTYKRSEHCLPTNSLQDAVPHTPIVKASKRFLYDLSEEAEEGDLPGQQSAFTPPQSPTTHTSAIISTAPYHQPGPWQPHVPRTSATGETLDLFFRVESLAGDPEEMQQDGQETSQMAQHGEGDRHGSNVSEDGLEMLLPMRYEPGAKQQKGL